MSILTPLKSILKNGGVEKPSHKNLPNKKYITNNLQFVNPSIKDQSHGLDKKTNSRCPLCMKERV